jgi:hypothetical protein
MWMQHNSLLLDLLFALFVVAIETDLNSYKMKSLPAPSVLNSKKGIMKAKTVFITSSPLRVRMPGKMFLVKMPRNCHR